jgi:hypothetical protein
MGKRQYYYLVAGLPDLVLDQARLPFPISAFVDELKAHLHPDDYALTTYLFLPADNRNLLNLLQKKERPWAENACYDQETLADGLREPTRLLPYMAQFVHNFQNQTPLAPNMSWKNQLLWLYYDFTIQSTEGFLKDCFILERDLRNILAALSARRNKISIDNQLIGDYDLTQTLRNSHARDFGLSGEFPFIERLLQWEDNSWIDREIALDAIHWDYIDQLNTFNYFSIDVILAYLIKLILLERWVKLDKADGESVFRNLLGNLENNIQFTNEFALS